MSTYPVEFKDLEEEIKVKQELIDRLCSQEPCPKCGYGVTGACYGCEIKRLQTKNKRLKEAIDLVYKRFDDGHHSYHKHFHGGCIFCDIEQVLQEESND